LRRSPVKSPATKTAAASADQPPLPRPRDRYVLRLFVAGATTRSRQAVLRVRHLCGGELKDRCRLEVVDIYQQPELARANQIVATPTLIKEFPRPVRRFIGNLSGIPALFAELDSLEEGTVAG
jgi:circadian clock protein KaiB